MPFFEKGRVIIGGKLKERIVDDFRASFLLRFIYLWTHLRKKLRTQTQLRKG
jgi:hypothetical protein